MKLLITDSLKLHLGYPPLLKYGIIKNLKSCPIRNNTLYDKGKQDETVQRFFNMSYAAYTSS